MSWPGLALQPLMCCLQVEGRDVWWQDVVPSQPTKCDVTWRAAEDPLFKVCLFGYLSAGTRCCGQLHTFWLQQQTRCTR